MRSVIRSSSNKHVELLLNLFTALLIDMNVAFFIILLTKISNVHKLDADLKDVMCHVTFAV